MCEGLLYSMIKFFFSNLTSVPVRCCLRDYPDRFIILDLWEKVYSIEWCCVTALYIPM